MNIIEGIDILKSILTNGYNYNGIEIKPINPIKIDISIKKDTIEIIFLDKHPTLLVTRQLLFLKPRISAPIEGIIIDTKKREITAIIDGWPDQTFEY